MSATLGGTQKLVKIGSMSGTLLGTENCVKIGSVCTRIGQKFRRNRFDVTYTGNRPKFL